MCYRQNFWNGGVEMKKRKKTITLLIDEYLLDKYTNVSKEMGISRNALINLVLRDFMIGEEE